LHYKSSGYLLRVPNELGFLSRYIKILRSYRNAWNSPARFLILIDENLPNPTQKTEGILKIIEHFEIFNDVVVVPSNGWFCALDIYTCFPYKLPSGQYGVFKKYVFLDHWIMEGKGIFEICLCFHKKYHMILVDAK
jgi:hypothetical protein